MAEKNKNMQNEEFSIMLILKMAYSCYFSFEEIWIFQIASKKIFIILGQFWCVENATIYIVALQLLTK